MTDFPKPRFFVALAAWILLGSLLLPSGFLMGAERLSTVGGAQRPGSGVAGVSRDERRPDRLRTWALAKGLNYEDECGGGHRWLLYCLRDGRPVYLQSHNDEAAASLSVPGVRDAGGFGFPGPARSLVYGISGCRSRRIWNSTLA